MNVNDNYKNNFANHKRAKKIDLSTVAEIMANKTNGYISEDLYEALKMVEAAGLGSEDKKLPDFIPTEKRKINYNENPLSKEADLILLLRAKAGDNDAVTKLYQIKKPLIEQATRKLYYSYASQSGALEKDFDFYMSVANEAFMLCIIQHPVCIYDDIMFSHIKFSFALSELLESNFSYTSKDPFKGIKSVAFDIRKQMAKAGIDTGDLTEKQYIDFCTSRNICPANTAKKAYSVYWSNNNCYTESDAVLEEFEDVKATENVDKVIDSIDLVTGKNEFIKILIQLKEDDEHGRDVDTLITHILGEKDFSFDKLYADNASDRESLAKTAEIMGYDDEYEVKLAMKRAKEFIFKYIKKNNPELFKVLTADRNVKKVK